ncbi:Fe-S cluster assembly protein [Legionella quinlivanii]|uniref:Fe-S cluster assembly protein n=1 Tax=Legionella quinlivanii TaxID=45073 RepID=A0A0W0XX07_9GAMM|nr:iron-sulfur cluster assembly accessory protein [Legionella quinlivanii]KTD49129.1 Fe-S cluster assembly protein [Legionella quinlivanii]MCW8450213.1 iron-sulfur cluster assembly accessory protein [Legionella quinlivanii]SEG43367.1 iron-sulfur cluster assembly protein [Legionella quinlivanii DSM 21216]STY11639.1 Fe-S cluster assembly protein [Legionella quinlivanii]
MSVVQQHVNDDSIMGISLSEAAIKHLLSYLKTQAGSKGVRFSVKKTGCSGLSYVVDYVNETVEDDASFPLNSDYQIYIDRKSYPYLKGMQIDYVKQGLNSKFIFNNPNQTGQCGCGESFTVD